MPPRAARALGTGYRGRGSRSPPAEPPHPSPRTPDLPHWDGMGLPRLRAPSRLLWWPALTQRGPEPRPSAPTAAHGFAGLAPAWPPLGASLPHHRCVPSTRDVGTWCKRWPSPCAGRASRDQCARGGREPVWGRGAPAQGAKHPSRCGRFLGEPKCYGSKSILRSNLSSLSSWPQEARLNHAGTMCGGGGCRFLPRRGPGDCRGARPAQWSPAGHAFSPPPSPPPSQPEPGLEHGPSAFPGKGSQTAPTPSGPPQNEIPQWLGVGGRLWAPVTVAPPWPSPRRARSR